MAITVNSEKIQVAAERVEREKERGKEEEKGPERGIMTGAGTESERENGTSEKERGVANLTAREIGRVREGGIGDNDDFLKDI